MSGAGFQWLLQQVKECLTGGWEEAFSYCCHRIRPMCSMKKVNEKMWGRWWVSAVVGQVREVGARDRERRGSGDRQRDKNRQGVREI